MLTRTFRFILPVLVVAALIWGLGASNATKDCNAAGMQQPYWNLISRFAGWITIIFNSVSNLCLSLSLFLLLLPFPSFYLSSYLEND